MAGAGGAVHLLVLPNARGFHEDLKKKVEKASKNVKAEVTIDPDLKKFHMELDKLDKRIDKMDGRKIDLFLHVHDDHAAKAVDDFVKDAQSESVNKKLTMDTSEAKKNISQFQKEQVNEPTKTYLQVDRFHADEEMDDFRQKQAEKVILQKVSLEFDQPRGKDGQQGGGKGRGGKSIMGVRNQVDVDGELLDAINLFPRMFKNINSQLDLGIRQVYDSYFNLFSKLYNFTSKPFINFTTMAREAKTLKEFFTGLTRQMQPFAKASSQVFSSFPKGIRALKSGMSGLKGLPNVLRIIKTDAISAAGGIKQLFDRFSAPAVVAIGKLRGAFVRFGHSISGGFIDSLNSARMQLSKLASGFIRSISLMGSGPGMTRLLDSIKDIGSSAKASLGSVGRASGTALRVAGGALQGLGGFDVKQIGIQLSGITERVKGAGRIMRYHLENTFGHLGPVLRNALANPISGLTEAFRDGAGAIADYWRAGMSKIGSLTTGMRMGVTRTMRGLASSISDGFKKAVYNVRNSFAGLQNFFGKMKDTVAKTFTGLQMGITRGFRGAMSGLASRFSGTVGLAKTAFGKIAGIAGKAFGAIANSEHLYKGIQAVFRRISTAAMGLSRVLMGTFGKVSGILMKSLMPALMAVGAGVMALGGQAAIGAVMALAGAIQSVLMGAIIMLPAAIGAAGIAFGVLNMGIKDVKMGLSAALSTDTVEEFEEAISKAHPAVKDLARAMRGFKEPIDKMKEAVQGNMLAGLDVGLKSTMSNLLPIFSEGAQKIASSWNKSFKGVFEELSSERASAGLAALMKGTEEMSIAMEPTLKNLVAGFGSLAEQGAKFLGPLGGWINGLSESFFNWAEGLRNIDPTTGLSKFDTIMESMRQNADYLGTIFSGLFGTLGNVLNAAAEGGGNLLRGMGEGLQGLKEATEKGTDGYNSIVAFMINAGDAAASLKQIMGPLLSTVMSVGIILTDIATFAMPGIAVALTGLKVGFESLEPYAAKFGESMGGVIESFAPLFAAVGGFLGPVLAGIADGLDKVFAPMKAGGPFDGFFAKLVELGPLLGNTFSVVGDALGKIFGALAPILESTLGFFEPFIPLFDLFAYWVGEIAVGIIQLLEPFLTLRDQAVGGLLEALMPLVEVIGQGLMGVIEALSPLMPILAELFIGIVNAVTPLIAPLTVLAETLFLALIDVINMVMPVIPPLVDLIIFLAGWIGERLIKAINLFVEIWQMIWPHVASILGSIINGVIVPLFLWLADRVKDLAGAISWAIDSVIIPVWKGLGWFIGKVAEGIVATIDNVIKPGIEGLKTAFHLVVEGIKSIWNGLKAIFAKPIKFFLETVVNNGIIRGWNWIGPKIGLGEIDPVNLGDLGNYHSGGVLPGYSPGKDNYNFVDPQKGTQISLAGGEAIMRPEWTAAVGGPKAVERMNSDARHGRLAPTPSRHSQGGVLGFGSFAGGGTLAKNPGVVITSDIQRSMEAAVAAAFPNQIITSATRYQDVGSGFDNHMAQRALDFAPSGALASWIASQYPNSAELFWDAGPNLKNGSPTRAIGGHSDHVHWAMSSMVDPYTGDIISQDGPGGGGGGVNPMLAAVRALFDKVSSTVFDPLKGMLSSQFGGNPFGMEVVGGLISKTVDAAVGKIKSSMDSFAGSSGGGGANWDPGAGAEQWRQGVIDAFRRQGEEPLKERVDALVRQIWTESKGNPNIAQQITDVNGTGPSAGLGLYQFIPGTFAGYRDPELPNDRTNPEAAHNAAVRYFRDRHRWNTGPGGVGLEKTGWKDGGVLPQFFDQGGLAGGIGVMQKNVLTPERVLSPSMTKAFDAFVYGFMPELARQFRQNPMDFRKHIGTLTAEVTRVHRELREGHMARVGDYLLSEFRSRAEGGNLANNPIDMNFDQDWFRRNGDKVSENIGRATRRLSDVIVDPDAYLEAEGRARQALEDEFEAKKKAAEEEADKAKTEAKEAEDEARRKAEEAEDSKAETDEEKEALKKQREEEATARQEVASAETEAARARQQEEDAKVEAAKADGSFYYGYKTFDAEGGNPNKTEVSREEGAFRSFMDSVAGRTGLGDTISGVTKRVDVLRSVGEAAQTAAPAWIAAMNGDPSGLAYNVAVGTAQVKKNAITEGEALAPSALAGILEMAIAGGNSNNAPFIGEVNSGMTQAELMQTLEHYEGMRARRGTGTTRVR